MLAALGVMTVGVTFACGVGYLLGWLLLAALGVMTVGVTFNPVGSSQLRSRSSSPWGAWLFFFALVKMTIGPLILSADMLDFISIISVR